MNEQTGQEKARKSLLVHNTHLWRRSHKKAVASNFCARTARTPARDSIPESFLKAGVGSIKGATSGLEESLLEENPTWVCGKRGWMDAIVCKT